MDSESVKLYYVSAKITETMHDNFSGWSRFAIPLYQLYVTSGNALRAIDGTAWNTWNPPSEH